MCAGIWVVAGGPIKAIVWPSLIVTQKGILFTMEYCKKWNVIKKLKPLKRECHLK